jgi:hypothetical protein
VLLHCKDCLAKRSLAAYLEYQKHFLPDVLSGRSRLLIVRNPGTRDARLAAWHLALAGDGRHAWCGDKIAQPWERKRALLDGGLLEKICPACRAAFERIAGEAA